MYRYLKNINEDEFRGYQKILLPFLGGEAAIQFGADCFAETIVNAVVEELAS
ncbi:hypothetical protein [Polynucleobacter necessarius]|uniref:hypothetical protein n=1 Tax=Polynucleobacter necessarius TaxID=576610 RepID=UPI0013B05F63|nr:hypothetical protein [Polynucleobacter necessarius]